jgi:4a-hydroxytetrahydrobiopterin dehydratase
VPRLTDDQARERADTLDGWELAGAAIRKRYTHADFKSAMAFVNRVAALAEEADHHPDILIEYDKVTLTLTSHDSGGLTERDFRLARKIDG